MHGKNLETIDLNKCLFQVLGFLTVDVSSPFFTLVEEVDDRVARGVTFSFIKDMEGDSDRIPADFTVVDVTRDIDEPDVSKMTEDEVSDFDAHLNETLDSELSNDNFTIIDWIGTEQHTVAGEIVLMTGYVARVSGRYRQYLVVRRRMAGRNICFIGTFDVRRTGDFMRPIMEMLVRVRAMRYNS